jgi:hypothetical protein
MKLLKHIIRAGALCGLLLTTAAAEAQTVQLKVMEWNVLSFEMTDKSNQIDFIVDEYVDLIKAQNPDIVCINELETGTSRMGKEKLTELASRLGMYPYFIMSYPKDVGFYGNGILSKYPILNSFSAQFTYRHANGEGNYQWNTGTNYNRYGYDQRSIGYVDILVPTSDSDGQIVRTLRPWPQRRAYVAVQRNRNLPGTGRPRVPDAATRRPEHQCEQPAGSHRAWRPHRRVVGRPYLRIPQRKMDEQRFQISSLPQCQRYGVALRPQSDHGNHGAQITACRTLKCRKHEKCK